ncbi:MAG: ferrous iron transporter B [Candidatus Riflebacteria bacterium]|nr:ferrous iron transporter B [Candidatus Riflebacteria bacterium]
MTTCNECSRCTLRGLSQGNPIGQLALVGNLNVGKSTLFSRITKGEPYFVNVPNSTSNVLATRAKHSDMTVFDTPGTFSIFATNEEEVISRDVLLMSSGSDKALGVIFVADVKNLKRSLTLALQYAEYGLPMSMVVNMMDEAPSRGIRIDTEKLSEIFGIDVHQTVIREGIGVQEIVEGISNMKTSRSIVEYPPRVESFLDLVGKILQPSSISPRLLGIMLLVSDSSVEKFVKKEFGPVVFKRLKDLVEEFHRADNASLPITLGNLYRKKAKQITEKVAVIEPSSGNPFTLKLGDWCTQILTGIPIALVILYFMYLFVGSFGATYLVDEIETTFFQGMVMPIANNLVRPIPSQFIRELLVDENFGVLPTGIFLALGLVGPVMFCFYLAFGVLEDSGYIQRLSVLLDRIFRLMGLNGKGVIPLMMGFSCVTMALLSVRVLDSEKERNIASFILFLGAPCAPMVGVMLTILERMPTYITFSLGIFVLLQMFLAGVVADKVLPGVTTPLLLELPPMRVPKLTGLLRSATFKTIFFLKEAIPMFVLSSVIVFVFQWVGGLKILEDSLKPIIDAFLGLPEDSVQIFLKALIRRESGATELLNLSGHYTHLQLIVSLLVMILMLPCTNAAMVLYKERGAKITAVLIFLTTVWAIAVGSLVNHFCLWSGITFT